MAHAPGCSIAWTTLGLADKNVFALVQRSKWGSVRRHVRRWRVRSTDNGAAWNPVNNGLTDTHIYGLAAHPTAANILLAATLEQGVFRSTNGGDSWQRTSPSGADNLALSRSTRPMALSPLRARSIMACTSHRTAAPASCQQQRPDQPRVWAIASAPSNATTVYAGTSSGVFRSTNRGNSWQPVGLAATKCERWPWIRNTPIASMRAPRAAAFG